MELQIRYISTLPGQQAPGIMLEFGNELYTDQGMPYFPNGSAYGKAMVPIVACARQLMPRAKLGACGSGYGRAYGDWNEGLRPYMHLFDGITHHNYNPRTRDVMALPKNIQASYVAGYSRAAARKDFRQTSESLGGIVKPLWLTEFGYGLESAGQCLMPDLVFGALHGAFHAARILAAIEQPGSYGAVTFETFAWRDPPPANYPQDWCGMPAGTATPGHANRPDLARVSGTGQLIAHLSARALAMSTMHPVEIVGHAPLLQMDILGEQQPCLQAAAFRGKKSAEAVLAILNICNTTIPVTLEGGGSVTVYDLMDPGGKAGLPAKPDDFPWPEPLHATTGKVPASGVYTAEPLSFAIVDCVAEPLSLASAALKAV